MRPHVAAYCPSFPARPPSFPAEPGISVGPLQGTAKSILASLRLSFASALRGTTWQLLFIEVPGGEWEGEAEGAVPVFPVVDSVTDAELRFDLGLLHFHVQLE